MSLIVLGFDPSISNFGVVALSIEPLEILKISVYSTKPTAKKKRPRECDDQTRRATELVIGLNDFIERARENHQIIAAAVEAGALPRIGGRACFTPTTASALGRARGILDGLLINVPCVDFTPMEVRQKILGEGAAKKVKSIKPIAKTSKEREAERKARKLKTQLKMEELFPKVQLLWPKSESLIEHAADALAVAFLCAQTDFVQQVLKGIRGGTNAKKIDAGRF
jgi:Holliday junction resolvasome RuvABC endonuclease subunit